MKMIIVEIQRNEKKLQKWKLSLHQETDKTTILKEIGGYNDELFMML